MKIEISEEVNDVVLQRYDVLYSGLPNSAMS
jgi:hypothetical protein